jgi:hypothetical protein
MVADTKKKYPPVPPGKRLIFRRFRVDPRTGKKVFAPPGKVFPIFVDV